MRKELLLEKKKKVIERFNTLSYRERNKFLFSKETLKEFSLNQLEIIVRMIDEINEERNAEQLFYPLSVNECVHFETGKIIYVDEDGVSEMTEEEILKGAARNTYKKYKKIMEDRKEEEQKEKEALKEKLK